MLFGACIFNGCGESRGFRLRISVAEEMLQLFFLPMYFFANSITTFATSSDMTFFFRHALANVFYFLLKYLFQISDIRPEVFLYIPDFILIP